MARPALHIRLLGNVDLRSGDAPLAPLESARAVSLLGYLLVHRGVPQPRQRLAFLLWPDSTEAQARTNLRHVLHTLRRGLPDAERFLEVTPQTLRWRADAPYRLDLADFEQALADGRLEAAVDAYAGDLLEGSYDDWVLEERERLRDRYGEALERLQRELEEREDRVGAIRCAERLVRHDPLREEAYRDLMRLHDARGDRGRALRAYHACAATLRREMGVPPSAATRAAYEALLPVDADAQSGAPSPAGPQLVGRAAERARLTELWRSAGRGTAQLVLVTGEPGIGKSRLVEELRSWCAHAGALTAEARAYAAEGAVAYGPVVAWLRSDALAARMRRLDRAHVTELARLLPELHAELPDLPRPEPLPEAEHRQRLFAALTSAILAPDAPLLLVADDLHWFDRPTLQFLHYLLRAGAAAPLLVAATARREEIDARDPAGELSAGLQALGRFSEIELGRLSRSETGVLAEKMIGAPLAETEAERLFAESEGNPLFLVEAVQADPGGAVPPAPGGGAKVQAVIGARLARLSGPASELAGVAATIGREFSAPVLADASGLDEQAFVGGLDELWRRGIVRADEHDVYDFSHGRIREAAYEALGPARRRHHHLRVARALERAHGPGAGAASGVLAAQYEAAGAAGEAVGWYVRAADAAQRLHDHAGAVRALERALALCGDLPASRERDARELAILTALPAPLNALDGYRSDRLVDVHERALGLAGTLHVEPEAPLVRSLAVAALTRGDFGAARAVGEQLRARGEREADDVLIVEGEWVLAIAAYWSGELDPARAHLEAALARWRPEHRAEHLLRYGQDTELACRIRLAHTLWLLGRHEDAARTCDAAVARADARGHPHTRMIVHLWAALIALDGRDEERLRAHAETLAVRESGPAERAVEAFAGFVDVLDGRSEPGLDRIHRVVDEAERGEPAAPGEEGLLVRVLVEACALAGDAQAGVAAADRALRTGNRAQPWEAEIRRLRGAFLHALGAPPAQVEAELGRAAAIAEGERAGALAARARETLARVGAERPEERLGNGWASRMPPNPDDVQRPDHRK
jgi:DNA-binding SARP family transcriptional activator